MTEQEAIEVIKILVQADGSCESCAGKLINKFIKVFPEYKPLAIAKFLIDFEANLPEDL